MVAVIRATQSLLLLLALGAAITAFVLGMDTYSGADGTCIVTSDGVGPHCALAPMYSAQGVAVIGMALAGLTTAAAAAALNGMVSKQGHQSQPAIQRPQPGPMQHPPTGPVPQQGYYQQPPNV